MISIPVNTHGLFHFRDLLQSIEGMRCRYCCPRLRFTSRGQMSVLPKNPLRIGVEIIKSEFILRPEQHKQPSCQPDTQACEIDPGKKPVF